MPFFTVPKAWHWGVGIKRPTSVGIKIPTSHSFRVGWDATLIRVKSIFKMLSIVAIKVKKPLFNVYYFCNIQYEYTMPMNHRNTVQCT